VPLDRDLQRLVHLVNSIAACLGEVNFVDYYARDFPGLLPHFPVLSTSDGLRNPPNLLHWLQNCLKYGCSSRDGDGLPHLLCKEGSFAVDWSRKVVAFYGILLGSERRGQRLSSGVSFNVASGTANSPEHWTVLSMVAESFGLQQLDRLPYGVSLPLRHVSFLFLFLMHAKDAQILQ
jgi:anaphase-promoting complex subunit 1